MASDMKRAGMLACALAALTVGTAMAETGKDAKPVAAPEVTVDQRVSNSVKRVDSLRNRIAQLNKKMVMAQAEGEEEPAMVSEEGESAGETASTEAAQGGSDVDQLRNEVQRLREELETILGQLEGMAESNLIVNQDVTRLNRTRLSGYIHIQWENTQNDATLTSTVRDGFTARRARIRLTHSFSDFWQGSIQADFVSGAQRNGANLRDAEIRYLIQPPAETAGLVVTFGQFDIPFSYEKIRSSGEREMPERSVMYDTLFRDQRDRGIMVTYGPAPNWQIDFGLFNGLTVGDPDQTGSHLANWGVVDFTNNRVRGEASSITNSGGDWRDIDGKPAFIGRTVWNPNSNLDLGFSFFFGERPAETIRRFNLASNGTITNTVVAQREKADRQLFNLEARVYSLFGRPGDTLRAEFLWGRDRVPLGPLGSTIQPYFNRETDIRGWYVQYLKDFGTRNTFAIRYDEWDPDTDTTGNSIQTVEVAWLYYFNEAVRLTASYQVPHETGRQVDNNRVIIRAQYRY